MTYEAVRKIKCPECGKEVREITTFNDEDQIVENHAFCADDNDGCCLWGGAWPNNHINVQNCKIREQRNLTSEASHDI